MISHTVKKKKTGVNFSLYIILFDFNTYLMLVTINNIPAKLHIANLSNANSRSSCATVHVSYGKYTHRQKLSNTTFFFGDTVWEVAKRNKWVIENKYLVF